MLDELSRRAGGTRAFARSELRFGASLTALGLAMSGVALLPQRAEAGCSTTGSLIIYQCDTGGVNIQPNASGASSLGVSDMTIPSGWINYSVSPSTASGPISMLLTVSNTSVTASGNGAINVSSQALPATITVNLGSDVTLQNTGGSGGLWVRNEIGGDIVVTSGASIISTGSDALTATSNAGSVSITNTGTVTSTDNRGIYADGSPTGGTTAVPVSVNNSGIVNAYLAGIRVIDYLGTASIQNSGTATSTTRQGLIAWSQSGDASIDNSGSVLARNYIGVQAMTDAGNVTVVNSGYIEAQRDVSLGASTTNQAISATATANVTVTNTATGQVIAGSDTGIYTTTDNGVISVTNAGRVTGTNGVTANATIGTVSVSNTGTITGTSGLGVSLASGNGDVTFTNGGRVTATGLAVSLDGTTNRLENTGTLTTTGTTAVQTGNGNSTVVVSGRIAAASASDTAIAMGSGSNRLVLADTATLVGKVTNASSNNMLELTGSATGTLDLGSVGATGNYQGFANLTKSGTGTWTLTGSGSSLSGTADINTGTLVLTGTLGVGTMTIGNTTQGTLQVNAGGALTSGHATIGTNSGGDGRVTVSGAGSTWTSTGNIYVGNGGNGALTVETGAVVSAVDGYVSTLTGSNSSLTVTGANSAVNLSGVFIAGYSSGTTATVTLSNGGQIRGLQGTLGDLAGSSGTMSISGSGSKWSAFVDNSVTYSGYMNVGRLGTGGLSVTDGGNVTGYRLYIGNEVGSVGTVTLSGAGSLIQMTSNLYVGSEGTGTLTLSDGAQVSAVAIKVGYLAGAVGTLNVGAAAGQTAAAAGTIDATEIVLGDGDSRLVLNHTATNYGIAANITGTGQVIVLNGTTVLTGTNTYTGATTISGGTLQIGDGGTSGSIVGNITDNASLVFNRSDTLTYAGVVSGTGSLTKTGTGTLTLTGANTYTGGTTVSAGRLAVNGSLAGNVGLATGATLSGSGSIAGLVQVNGGTLAGAQTAPLTMGALTLASASNVNVTLGAPSANAAFIVLGNLTLDGTLNVTANAGFGSGVYRIINYGGVLTDNGLDVAAVSGLAATVQTAVAGQVNLLVSDPGQTILFWNGTTITPTGTVVGGNGTWTASPQTNWTDSSGTVPQAWNSGFAVFQGTAGTVTVDTSAGAVSTTGMQFVTSGYLVTGDALTLAGTAQATIRVGDGTSAGSSTVATIASALTGTGGINKSDLGTLILSGTNTYTGGTTITAGTLQIGAGGTSGSIAGDVADNGSLVFNRSDALTFAGAISGTGSLTKTGAGTLTLTGANTYTGGTTVASGTLVGNTTSLTGNIVDNTTLVFNQTSTGTYSGVISGTGSLTKTGTGTLVLTGENTYTGGTLISQGTLQIGNGGTTGSIAGDVVNNATLVFNRSGTYNFPGTITGSGAVIIVGGSTVNFTGASGYNGAITIADSSFVLASGAVSNSSYTIGSGGTISGTGTIAGLTVASGGTAAPGYSPGTLTVAGNVTFNAGSTYAVDVTPTGAHDLITATGTATILGGTVAVNATAGGYGPTSTLTILQAAGGVTGTFASVTSNLAFLTPLLSYDANDVYLTLRRNDISFASQALTANERAVAAAADGLGWSNPVYYALANLAVGAAPAAFDSLSGEAYASAGTVMLQQSLYLREAVGARLGQALSPATAAAGPATAALAPGLTPTLWMQGFGAWGNAWGDGNAATVSSDIAGVFAGADVALGDTWRVGLMGGYSRTTLDVDARASSGTIDNYDIGLYAGARYGDLGLKAGLSYTWHDAAMSRTVVFTGYSGTNTSGYDAGTTQLFGEAGYTVRLNGATLEPFAGLAYVHLSTDGLTETGSSSALAVSTGDMDTVFSSLGLRVGTNVTLAPGVTVTPSLSLAWLHAFGDVAPAATMAFASGSQPFAVTGVPLARDSALIGAALDYRLTANAVLSASYSGQIASGIQDNAFKGALTVSF